MNVVPFRRGRVYSDEETADEIIAIYGAAAGLELRRLIVFMEPDARPPLEAIADIIAKKTGFDWYVEEPTRRSEAAESTVRLSDSDGASDSRTAPMGDPLTDCQRREFLVSPEGFEPSTN